MDFTPLPGASVMPTNPMTAPTLSQAPQAPPDADYQKMMLAQALMGGGGGGAPTSFAGGLAQGMNPMLRAMMMQKMNPQQIQPLQAQPMPAAPQA